MRSWFPYVALGLSALVLLSLCGQQRTVEPPQATVPSPLASAAPADWPIVPLAAGSPAPYLRTLVNRPRGALRVILPGSALPGPWSLHVVAAHEARPRVDKFAPGFEAADFVEFYGLEAGSRHVYLQCGERVGPLQRVEIRPSGIVELAAPSLAAPTTRELDVRNAGAVGANLLLEYDGFELLVPWSGTPITLRSPLDRPRRVVVSATAPGGADGRVRLGFVQELEATDAAVRVDVPSREGVVALVAEPDAAPSPAVPGAAPSALDYRLHVSAGHGVVDSRSRGREQDVLAVLPRAEFARPPRVHSWVAGERAQQLAVEGVGDGPLWVGVGVSRHARYMLWREQGGGSHTVRRLAVPSVANGPMPGLAVLPGWIRTIGQEKVLAPGTRQEHAQGPSQIWEEVDRGDLAWRRLVAWTDASGARRTEAAAQVEVPWPAGVKPGDQVQLTVTTPHALRGDGERFSCTHRGPSPPLLPDLPDGLLNGLLIQRGRVAQTLRAVIEGGKVLDPGAGWGPPAPAAVPPPEHGLDVLVTDETGVPLAGAGCYGEGGGSAVGTTTVDGRVRLLTDAARTPLLLSVRAGTDEFTHNAYLTGPLHTVRVPRRAADAPRLGWAQVPSMTGVDLDGLGIGSLMLAHLPRGETAVIAAGGSVRLPAPAAANGASDVLEFVASGAGVDLWGWIGIDAARGALAGASGASAPSGTAELLVVNRSAARTVHVTLPRTELRLGVDSLRQRRLRVAAPVRLSLLSIVAAGTNGEQLLVDEGVTAELLAGDVLVVTYDDVR